MRMTTGCSGRPPSLRSGDVAPSLPLTRVLGNSGAPRVIHYLGSIEIRRAWPPLSY